MAISRMDMERQLRAGGGIMTLEEPRQRYFLGKLVKKAKRAVKKVVKSPLGKMAILGGLGMYAGGLGPFSGLKGAGFLRGTGSGLLGKLKSGEGFLGGLGNMFRHDPSLGTGSKFSMGKMLLGGLGATAIAAPFLMGGQEEEEDDSIPFGDPLPLIEGVRDKAKAYYSDPTNSALYFMPPKSAVQRSFYAADGGLASLRPGYAGGQLVGPSGDGSRPGYAGDSPSILDVIKSFPSAVNQIFSGSTSAFLGGDQEKINEIMTKKGYGIDLEPDVIEMIIEMNKKGSDIDTISSVTGADSGSVSNIIDMLNMNIEQKAYGGRIGKAEGGIMDLGGLEKDYREGGFVPLGAEERADDVPARLSKNEFVFTADAVRAAGQGDIDQGAEVMQNMMDNLEAGGTISEESQGMENPAQEMFDQSQMLENRIV